MNNLFQKFDFLFPKREIFQQKISFRHQLMIFGVFGIIFYGVSYLLPAGGFIGFDWVGWISQGGVPEFYPPWGTAAIQMLSWPLLISLGMAGIGLAVIKRSAHPISAMMVFLSLPVFWTVFLGQLEGLVVLGLLGLPWLTPLALLKPQVSIFAFAARRSYLFGFLVWIILSLLIWGMWPLRMFARNEYLGTGRFDQNIAIGWWGILAALPMLWYSRGDMDMLMISGTLMTSHLIPYNMLPFVPAIARLRPLPALAACLLSWLPLSANWLGPWGWWLGWIFVVWLWCWLAIQRRAEHKTSENKNIG